MSTLVELITALVFGVFGISEEIPPENNTNTVVIECCDIKKEPSSDLLFVNTNSENENLFVLNSFQKSIKIEHNKTVNNLL